MINKQMKPESITIKDCDSIGEMIDYILELNLTYDKVLSFLDSSLDNLKTSYKYFNENEYNRCYFKLEELKRDIQIIRRNTDILDDRIFDSTLPDNAMCFLFDESLKEINKKISKMNNKFNIVLEKINFKFFLIKN